MKFWLRVNSVNVLSEHAALYAMGVELQNLETRVLEALAKAKSKKQKGKS